MGIKLAMENGVKYRNEGRLTFYTVKCAICGESFEHIRYNPIHVNNYKCKTCKTNEKIIDDGVLYANKEARFERAVMRVESKVKSIEPYQKAIAIIRKNLHTKGWFNSTEEIMVALELLKNKIKIIPQQKIGKYRIDYAIPEMKVLLEVDGAVFHHDKISEGIRDGNVLLQIGVDWDIVRINTDLINKDITKLVQAIKEVREIKQRNQ